MHTHPERERERERERDRQTDRQTESWKNPGPRVSSVLGSNSLLLAARVSHMSCFQSSGLIPAAWGPDGP